MTRPFPWLSCRGREWARHVGALPPMRMTASWFGSFADPPNTRLWREASRPGKQAPLGSQLWRPINYGDPNDLDRKSSIQGQGEVGVEVIAILHEKAPSPSFG